MWDMDEIDSNIVRSQRMRGFNGGIFQAGGIRSVVMKEEDEHLSCDTVSRGPSFTSVHLSCPIPNW